MKILPLILLVITLSGCASPISRVSARFNCQDYSNAWARDATRKGLTAGVLVYKIEGEVGHCINWVVDENDGRIVFIEPQTGTRIPNPAKRRGYTEIHKTIGTMIGYVNRGNVDVYFQVYQGN